MTRQDKTALSGKGRGILQERKWQAKMISLQDGAAESLRLCSELGKLIYGLWFKPWPFEFCGQVDIEYLCYCPKLGKLVFSLWGLSSKSSLYHTSLARAYNHDTIWVKELSSWKHPPSPPPKKNNSGPTKPLSYENITKLELVVWHEYSEIIGFEYYGSGSMSKSPNASMIHGEEWDGHKHEAICLFEKYADNHIHPVNYLDNFIQWFEMWNAIGCVQSDQVRWSWWESLRRPPFQE